jgi:chemotaxis response regulator CheB
MAMPAAAGCRRIIVGSGSDGADGLRAIKEDGGTALVQRP